MQINRQGRLYRFAYFFVKEKRRPKTTNLCAFIAQLLATVVLTTAFTVVFTVVGMLVAGAITVLVGSLLWTAIQDVIHHPYDAMINGLIVFGVVLTIIAALITVLGVNYWFNTETGKVFGAYLKAKKQKVCPIVQFV